VPGHDCGWTRVHINLELTDSGSRRVGSPRGVLKGAHPVVMVAWWNCWWVGAGATTRWPRWKKF
jgi:hypothetical protein